MTYSKLITEARDVLKPRKLPGGDAGDVAAALMTKSGNIYTGVCIDVSSGIGFCAEHSAIAAMITAGESEISSIVAVWGEDTILPPCGRCRELINQIHANNLDGTEVVVERNRAIKLRELLPLPYQETWDSNDGI
jgi:cytidine deaminase